MELDSMIEELAAAAHQVWADGKLKAGWRYGPVTDKDNKIHSCLVPYADLGEPDKESDRDFVRAIPKILEIAGYRLEKS